MYTQALQIWKAWQETAHSPSLLVKVDVGHRGSILSIAHQTCWPRGRWESSKWVRTSLPSREIWCKTSSLGYPARRTNVSVISLLDATWYSARPNCHVDQIFMWLVLNERQQQSRKYANYKQSWRTNKLRYSYERNANKRVSLLHNIQTLTRPFLLLVWSPGLVLWKSLVASA